MSCLSHLHFCNIKKTLLTKKDKEGLLNEYSEIFNNLATGIIVDYKGMTVFEITEFRKKLIVSDAYFRVLKNRIAKRAIASSPLKEIANELVETKALIYGKTDMVTLAKLVCLQLKELGKCQLISGFTLEAGQAQFLNEKEVVVMSKLASKEELLSKLLFLLNAPLTNFVRTLNEIPTKFVRLLSAIADNKK